jgi:hypothetical protein
VWSGRRFVPIVIPGFIFCATLGAHTVLESIPKPWFFAAAVVAVAFLSIFTFRAGSLIFSFTEDRGYFSEMEALARKLPSDELIVANANEVILTPLYVAFDRKVVPVRVGSRGRKAWLAWVAMQAGRQRPAYFLAEGQRSADGTTYFAQRQRFDLERLGALQVEEAIISRSFAEPTVDPLPKKIVTDTRTVRLYKVTGARPDQ